MSAADKARLGGRPTHPGPQLPVPGLPTSFWLLLVLILLTGLLLLQSLVHKNLALVFSDLDPAKLAAQTGFWSLELLSPDAASALMIGLLTVLYTRKQLALGFRPYFNYSCHKVLDSEYGLNLGVGADQCKLWIATLSNIGQGLAVVSQARYSLLLQGQPQQTELSYEQALAYLAEQCGWQPGREFSLVNISHGWSLGANGSRRILEIRHELTAQLQRLDISVEFAGLLGDRYHKDIWCIPRLGT